MAGLNRASKAKSIKNSKQYSDSNININGQYQAQYSQGIDAYHSHVQFSACWSAAKKEGWRRALNDDKKLYDMCSKESVRKSIEHRIHCAFGLEEETKKAA